MDWRLQKAEPHVLRRQSAAAVRVITNNSPTEDVEIVLSQVGWPGRSNRFTGQIGTGTARMALSRAVGSFE